MAEEDWDTDADATELAVEWFKAKLAMMPDEFYALEQSARARAFTVSGVTELDSVSVVYDAVERALKDGTSIDEFKASVGELFTSDANLETVFRTNVQSAYSAGRYIQNNRPEVRATHPYSKFSAILDGHETDICHDLDGTILPSDDPFWASHQPPLHFNCRSDVTAISDEEAKAAGGVDEETPDTEADEGFGGILEPYEPDLSTRPPDLAAIYEMKQHL